LRSRSRALRTWPAAATLKPKWLVLGNPSGTSPSVSATSEPSDEKDQAMLVVVHPFGEPEVLAVEGG
jgi:hypothetical protein